MATHHASPGEIVNLATWADDLDSEKTKAIVKTDTMQLARLVIKAGSELSNHAVSGPLIIHCIENKMQITAMGATQEVSQGELLFLMPGEPHSVRAMENSVALITIIFK